MSLCIARNRLATLDDVRQFRPWANYRHVTFEHVDELRDPIDSRLGEEPNQRGSPSTGRLRSPPRFVAGDAAIVRNLYIVKRRRCVRRGTCRKMIGPGLDTRTASAAHRPGDHDNADEAEKKVECTLCGDLFRVAIRDAATKPAARRCSFGIGHHPQRNQSRTNVAPRAPRPGLSGGFAATARAASQATSRRDDHVGGIRMSGRRR